MITLLKCETCGGSDFKKHELIDEFLVCTNCGNQYMTEIRNIEKDLPLDLKTNIKGNYNELEANNCIIKGDYNEIKGDYNIAIGDYNELRGIGNIAKGDYNETKKPKKKKKLKKF
jgi:uncharacterized Zn finger protein